MARVSLEQPATTLTCLDVYLRTTVTAQCA